MPVHPSRKDSEPYRASQMQHWASNVIEAQHEEALYMYGELSLFTLMWRVPDFEAGLVTRCSTCFGGAKSRQAAAFEQATVMNCPDCYGSTFEGGYRAQIVRPALVSDRNPELVDQARGTVTIENLRFETTADFTMHKGDYLFRYDNTRYQCEEKSEGVVRTGFGPTLSTDSFVAASDAHREEDTSAAFQIPPKDPLVLANLLGNTGPFTVSTLTALDVIRPGGYI